MECVWRARTRPRFGSTRQVAPAEGGDASPQSTAIGMAQTHRVPTQLWIWPASLKGMMTIPHALMTQPKPSLTSSNALMTLLMVLVTFHNGLVTSHIVLVTSRNVSETILFISETFPNMLKTMLFVLETLLKPLEWSPRRWTSFRGNLLQFFAPMPARRWRQAQRLTVLGSGKTRQGCPVRESGSWHWLGHRHFARRDWPD